MSDVQWITPSDAGAQVAYTPQSVLVRRTGGSLVLAFTPREWDQFLVDLRAGRYSRHTVRY